MIDFKHENVLSLIGVVYDEGERPLVVLPYMENGDLCTFIKKDDVVSPKCNCFVSLICISASIIQHNDEDNILFSSYLRLQVGKITPNNEHVIKLIGLPTPRIGNLLKRKTAITQI